MRIDTVDTFQSVNPRNTNINTQNNGFKKVTPSKHGNVLVSMLDFWGV